MPLGGRYPKGVQQVAARMPKTTEVAIVGGGVIGCSIAYYLAAQGIRSTVFEQRRFGHGASSATVGAVAPLSHIDPSDEPSFALGMRSLGMFPGLAADLTEAGIDPEFRQSGILKVALTPEDRSHLLDDLAWQGETDLEVEWLDPKQVIDREPQINPVVLGGVLSPREGFVRGQRLVDSLVQAAGRRGATFEESVEVVGLESEGATVVGVRTTQGIVNAGHTVLASGPWTGLADRWRPAGQLPVRPVKGQRLLLRKTAFLPRTPVYNCSHYVVPQVDGNLLVGATRHESEFDQEITVDAVSLLVESAARTFPGLRDAKFVTAQAGVRPGSPDDRAILGPVPGCEGLSVASGHDAIGIMLAPGTGQLMADYIASGDATPLEPFSLSRFS